MPRSLRTDLHKTQIMLDGLPALSVVLDCDRHAWQYGGAYWYCAFSSGKRSSFELAQLAPITVIHDAAPGSVAP